MMVIQKFRALARPRMEAGRIALAEMNVVHGPLLLVGCRLVVCPQTRNAHVRLPRDGRKVRTLITDPATHNALVTAACGAYAALTGQDPKRVEPPLATASEEG
jgi:hypothetical protein